MKVLVTGAYGRVGTALIDHLADREAYEFTYLNRSDRPADHPYGGHDTVVADVANYDAIRPAFDGQDAVVHLAAYPTTDGRWEDVFEPNLVGMNNVLKAAREAEVGTFVFGSTHHVVGMYETDNAPEIYDPDFGLVIDHTDPVRPDSHYAATKVFGEAYGRYYTENFDYPTRFYALRIGSVRMPDDDHPYGDAESGFSVSATLGTDEADANPDRDSERYRRKVLRMKSTWQSRRDCAHQFDCCLRDDDVTFDVFYGVSDNDRRWLDIDHAREVVGYDPQDNAEEWDAPPE
ncbi:NAD-dependent epimerase/dehydratase family protein [Candidatus Halobonum tyrrellensis]|uniref:NAD-dependent epimerase/dehydratase family protein n=1 Tax=Candidatus Halobonum tyrrellensis TaxID=1431545 RepID=UPI000677DDA5|nr:NAD(P)-dependent oxidoreductase [Candidatus Halobonum tyrrellensis]